MPEDDRVAVPVAFGGEQAVHAEFVDRSLRQLHRVAQVFVLTQGGRRLEGGLRRIEGRCRAVALQGEDLRAAVFVDPFEMAVAEFLLFRVFRIEGEGVAGGVCLAEFRLRFEFGDDRLQFRDECGEFAKEVPDLG